MRVIKGMTKVSLHSSLEGLKIVSLSKEGGEERVTVHKGSNLTEEIYYFIILISTTHYIIATFQFYMEMYSTRTYIKKITIDLTKYDSD